MTKRREKLVTKIAQLQAQLKQVEAQQREKDRKRRNRQSIIGFTTLQGHLERGGEVHLTSPGDLIAFLRQHVTGPSNRKTWDFDEPASKTSNDNALSSQPKSEKKTPAKRRQTKQKTTAKQPQKKILQESASQEELKGEFNL